MLIAKNLHAGYGAIPILTGIDFRLDRGEALGVLGHNGMGKTTLLRTLMGYLPATAGSIILDGTDITGRPPHERASRGMGYVPQGRQIFPTLSVLENIQIGATGDSRQRSLQVEEILSEFPRLRRLLERPGGALSGGEQQLLALARCLCSRPPIALLDEPTEGIQPSIVEEIAETLVSIRRRRTLAIIVVEQNLDFIAAVSERVLIIQKGRIRAQVESSELSNASLISEFAGMPA